MAGTDLKGAVGLPQKRLSIGRHANVDEIVFLSIVVFCFTQILLLLIERYRPFHETDSWNGSSPNFSWNCQARQMGVSCSTPPFAALSFVQARSLWRRRCPSWSRSAGQDLSFCDEI